MSKFERLRFYLKRSFVGLVMNSSHVFIAILVFLVGLRGVLTPWRLERGSIALLLPTWLSVLWGCLLMAGGAMILAGSALWQPQLEKAGITAKVGGALIYITGLVIFNGALYVILIWTALVLAGVARYWSLNRLMNDFYKE